MAESQKESEKGVSIFLDVFRRADKNDDGALSWDEFKSFFSDGILSSEDLLKLFNEIDTHNTNNLDTSEICEFFTKHLGPFAQVFGCLEDMNGAVINSLMTTAKNYSEASLIDKFMTRFLLKEVVGQLGCLGNHLDTAVEKIDEQELKNRPVEPIVVEEAQTTRKMRKMQRSYGQQTSVEGPVKNALTGEVDRLADLISKLECKIKFDAVEEEDVDPDNAEQILLICRKFKVIPQKDTKFRESLKRYICSTSLADGSLHLCLRSFRGTNQFALYEIWESTEEHLRHFTDEPSKSLMHDNIENLEQPEDFSKMTIPASWWSRDRN